MRTTEQKADVLWRRRNLSSSGTGVDLTTATGILAIAKGGTGATSAPAALTSLGAYPSTNPSGFTSNLGTVTSVDASVPAFLSISGNPVTTTGTLAITYSGTALPVANGGTGITSFGTGVATWLGTPSSANLAAAITDETGSGALVFGTSPTLSSPTITGTGTAAFGNLSYTGTLTGGTGIVNLGSGQFYKDASGNLGLGVTPSAWTGSSATVLEFGSKGDALYGNVSAVGVTYNAYFDSAWKYGTTGFASYYVQTGGKHQWYNAPSGTAGNAITFTQAMTLDASGNLGVGTTSPDAKLDVVSTNLVGVFGSESVSNAYIGFKYNSTILGYVGNGSGVAGGSAATDFSIGSTGARALTFGTNDLERARITSGGNLLVGTTSSGSLNGRVAVSGASGNASIGTLSGSGTGALDTGISINQTNGGACIVLIASRNTGVGTATAAAVYIVRFYYDGNNAPTTVYVGGSADFVTFGVSGSNTLTLTNAGGGNTQYSWFGNK